LTLWDRKNKDLFVAEISQTKRTENELAHARAVREMFSGIASRYDFLNHFLSVNTDKRWRRLVRKKLETVLKNPNALVLDVACGTGDLSLELQKNAAAKIIGTDFCRPMLEIAFRKNAKNQTAIPYIEGDALILPFQSNSFDAVTIAFGLRNLANWKDGLIELHRILKTGGKLAILEFSCPIVPGFRQLFNFYFSTILPRIGGAVSGSRGAYEYLPDSVARFPDQKELVKMLQETGFDTVEFQNRL
jgi:demethylmenaquinone methyltransferase/2-methoxy-6-polyprenyl-1,4-benzoquinol methylase